MSEPLNRTIQRLVARLRAVRRFGGGERGQAHFPRVLLSTCAHVRRGPVPFCQGLLCVLLVLTGCSVDERGMLIPLHQRRGSTAQADTDKSGAERSKTDELTSPVALGLSFDVMRIELPVEPIRHSAKIWNHVDEWNEDPTVPGRLARNGMRLGVADENDWPALKTLFEQVGAKSDERRLVMTEGQPLMINLGELPAGQSYFLHRRTGQLEGGVFADSEKFLRIEFVADDSELSELRLRITPESVEKTRRRKLVSRQGQVREIAEAQGVLFSDLSATVSLETGQFVVIGPGERATEGYRLGSWWFQSQLRSEPMEAVVLIKPQPVRLK